MPKHARLLRDLLDEKSRLEESTQVWKNSASAYFVEVRSAAAVSQTQFAKELDISTPYLNQIEHGHRTPSSETVERLLTFVEGEASGDTDQSKEDEG